MNLLLAVLPLICTSPSIIVHLPPGVPISALQLDQHEPRPTAPLGTSPDGGYIITVASSQDAERLLARLREDRAAFIKSAECNMHHKS